MQSLVYGIANKLAIIWPLDIEPESFDKTVCALSHLTVSLTYFG